MKGFAENCLPEKKNCLLSVLAQEVWEAFLTVRIWACVLLAFS